MRYRFRNKVLPWIFMVWLMAWIPYLAHAQTFPSRPVPPRLVNDYVQLLTPNQREALEQKLLAFNDSTSTQIAIVIMQETGGYPASQYAPELMQNWGIGQKGKDNGVLIFINISEREMYVATGYGVEEFITDARAGDVIADDLRPHFRKEQYYEGLDAASTHLMQMLSGTFKAEKKSSRPGTGGLLLVVILIVVVVILSSRFKGGGGGFHRTFGGPPGGWGRFPGGGMGGGFGGGGFGGFGGGGAGGGGAGGRW